MNRYARFLASLLLTLGSACDSPTMMEENPPPPPPPKGPADVDHLEIADATYYPESLSVSADGTIYVGSLGTGLIKKFNPKTTTAVDFVGAGTLKAVAGVLVDDSKSLLWVCATDLAMTNPTPPTIKSYSLIDGSQKGSYTFSAPAFPNDLAFDGKHNLYVADSYGKIWRLPDGGTTLSVWSMDAKLASTQPMGFGADGIAWDGGSNIYVNIFTDSRLHRLPINTDGSAGTIVDIGVTTGLTNPDGMRMLDANNLILVQGGGASQLTKMNINGVMASGTTVMGGLDGPTSVVKYENYYWVSEGQLGHLFGQIPGPPSLPFKIRRISAQ